MALFPTLTVATNSYVTLAEADAYVTNERSSQFTPSATTWEDRTDAEKTFGLLQAIQHMAQLDPLGTLTDSDQALPFPRTSVSSQYTPDAETDIVPWRVKVAQIEEAIEICNRQNWTTRRVIKHEKVNGQEQVNDPDVIMFSTVAYRIMLESGWIAQYGMEVDD